VDDIVNTMIQQQQQQPSSNELLHGDKSCQPHDRNQQRVDNGGGDDVGSLQPAAVVSADDGSDATPLMASRFRRSGSERLRDGAKAILRRVESLKTRRRKQKNRDGVVVIGSPQVRVPSFAATTTR